MMLLYFDKEWILDCLKEILIILRVYKLEGS